MIGKKYFPLHLPCKPYIKKFVAHQYGHPLKADHNSTIGCFINISLEKKIYENRNFHKQSFVFKGMEDNIKVIISAWQFARLGYDLSTENIIVINRYLENLFAESLYHYVRHHKTPSRALGYKYAIESFAKKYNIELEYDITFDGLKKMEYRFRKSVEAVNNN